ncbi:MAG: hypothetical protein JWR51_4712 [Devosia sp.]|uniref:hypothetical protein n=1 Tax=Devosia sp. TaxID=1871048 RepID=UPI002615BB79|nr:hypothetical protein [Devosia sp.]MDB5531609.1 hypothetical protein [Devosia sp.]
MSGLTNSTFGDIVLAALRNTGIVGLGQTATSEDMNQACAALNDMIAQWQQRRYLVYRLVEQSVPCNGQQYYEIGPGGDISVAERPAAINAAFARQTISDSPNQIDYPITVLPSRETYSQIAMKSLQSFPQWCWYDAGTPLGKLYVYPVISNQFELHVIFRQQLQTALALTDEITLPGEYREALVYNLAIRLSANYGVPLSPNVAGLAKAALETMRSVNAQIPTMSMPSILRNDVRWNIFSDQAGPGTY